MYKKIIICFALLSIGSSLFADNNIAKLLESISSNNLEIKSASTSLSNDSSQLVLNNNMEDPKVDFEYLLGNAGNGDKWAIGISQGFDFPSAYSARKAANSSRVSAMSYLALDKKLNILLNAKLLCIKLISTNKQADAQKLVYDNINTLFNEYTKSYNHGEVNVLDINKLKLELVSTKQKLDEYKANSKALATELSGLNNNRDFGIDSFESINSYPEEILEYIDNYISSSNSYNPKGLYYTQMEKTLNQDAKVAKLGGYPRFDIGYKYSNEINEGFNGVTLGVSIPLFSNRNKRNAVKAASIANAMEQESSNTSRIAEIKSKYMQAVSLKSQIESYKTILNDNNNFLLLKKALDGGQITLLNYLLEIDYFLKAQSDFYNLEYNYYTLLAELNKYNLIR